MSRLFNSSKPDHWVSPKAYTDASLRLKTHGPIRPMEEKRPSFLMRFFRAT